MSLVKYGYKILFFLTLLKVKPLQVSCIYTHPRPIWCVLGAAIAMLYCYTFHRFFSSVGKLLLLGGKDWTLRILLKLALTLLMEDFYFAIKPYIYRTFRYLLA